MSEKVPWNVKKRLGKHLKHVQRHWMHVWRLSLIHLLTVHRFLVLTCFRKVLSTRWAEFTGTSVAKLSVSHSTDYSCQSHVKEENITASPGVCASLELGKNTIQHVRNRGHAERTEQNATRWMAVPIANEWQCIDRCLFLSCGGANRRMTPRNSAYTYRNDEDD